MAAFGAKSRFSFLYQTLKFKPTDTKFEDSRHGQEVSFESVKEINPDIPLCHQPYPCHRWGQL